MLHQGTSDSCETTDETGLFNYMLAHKLITIGWIHTHPKQVNLRCFFRDRSIHSKQSKVCQGKSKFHCRNDTEKPRRCIRLAAFRKLKFLALYVGAGLDSWRWSCMTRPRVVFRPLCAVCRVPCAAWHVFVWKYALTYMNVT